MPSLADLISNRVGRAFNAAESIEAKISAVIPQLQSIAPILGTSDLKQQAVVATLREVTQLAKDVQSEIEASRLHLVEGSEVLQELKEAAIEHRHDMAHVATIARGLDVFLQDPVYLRAIVEQAGVGVVKMILEELEANERPA